MRLFVALPLPDEVKEEIRRRTAGLQGELPRARWVRPEALHLTLAFLGETEPSLVAPLTTSLSAACDPFPPARCRLSGAGAFPPRGTARVLWLGVEAPAFLADLQRAVAEAVFPIVGKEPDRRPFRAHLTVARCQPPWPQWAVDRFSHAIPGPVGEPFTATEGVLFESHLLPSGARYSVVASFPLRGGQ